MGRGFAATFGFFDEGRRPMAVVIVHYAAATAVRKYEESDSAGIHSGLRKGNSAIDQFIWP